MTRAILFLPLISFVLSWTTTLIVRRIAPAVGFVDKPGGRKIHANPKPLGGGIAIFTGVALPLLGILILLHTPIFNERSNRFNPALVRGAIAKNLRSRWGWSARCSQCMCWGSSTTAGRWGLI